MAQIRIHRDGTVEAMSGTQDIGGGARTVVLLLVSREFGYLPLEKIRVRVGDSDFGASGASAGSSTTGMVTMEIQKAAKSVRDKFFEEIAGKMKAKSGDLEVREGGRIGLRGREQSIPWDEACGFLRDSVLGHVPTIVDPDAQWCVVTDDGEFEQASEENYRA